MQIINLLVVLLLLVSHISFGQKKEVKQARKLEKSNLHMLAAEKYMKALDKDRYYIDAINGLKRNGQKVIDGFLSDFYIAHGQESYLNSLSSFEKAEDYRDEIRFYGVELSFPAYYQEYYEEDKNNLLGSFYENAERALLDKNYSKAKSEFQKILSYDPHFRDTGNRIQECGARPMYDQAIEAYSAGQLNKAFYLLDETLQKDPTFEDAQLLMNRIKNEETYGISVIAGEIDSMGVNTHFKNILVSTLSNLNSPIIHIVDRDNLDEIIEEQKLYFSGLLDERTAAKVGKLIGAKATLLTDVVREELSRGRVIESNQTAHQSVREPYFDSRSNDTRYRYSYQPVNYVEYHRTDIVIISVRYQLVDSETAEVLHSNMVNLNERNEIVFAEFNGDPTSLYPTVNGRMYKFGSKRDEFLQLFDGVSFEAEEESLFLKCENKAAQIIANELDLFLNSSH